MTAIPRIARVIGACALLLAALAGWPATPVVTAQDGTGTLVIALADEQGTPVGGGCFDVTDAAGTAQSICDDDGDGLVSLAGLPAGAVSVAQASGPDGYQLASPGSTTIEAGAEASIQLIAAPFVVETPIPTEEPTAAPTSEPTEETPAPDESTPQSSEPSFSLAGIAVSLSQTVRSNRNAVPNGGVIPASSVSDEVAINWPDFVGEGTLTFVLFDSIDCSGQPAQMETLSVDPFGDPVTSTMSVTDPGFYNFVVTYSGDNDHDPLSTTCGEAGFAVGPLAAPLVTTELLNGGTGLPIPLGSHVPYGSGPRLTSAVEPIVASPGGDNGALIWTLYTDSACSGFAPNIMHTNLLPPVNYSAGGTTLPYDFPTPGTYYVSVYYYAGEEGINQSTEPECMLAFTVDPLQTTLNVITPQPIYATYQSTIAGSDLGNAVLPGGSVTYSLYNGDACGGVPVFTSGPFTPVNGSVRPSDAYQLTSTGAFSWQAVYSGDTNHLGSTSNCAPISVRDRHVLFDKTTDQTADSVGDTAAYTITISNPGNDPAIDTLVITDQLAAGLTWQLGAVQTSGTFATPPSCGITTGTLTCTVVRLEPGASLTVPVSAVITASYCGTLSNTASFTSTNGGTGTATADDMTIPCPQLTVTKTGPDGPVGPADNLIYQIAVTNPVEGSLASKVVVTDRLPEGFIWQAQPSTDGLDCSIDDGTGELSCSVDTLAGGASAIVDLTGTSTGYQCGVISNVAAAKADNVELVQSNTVNITVLCPDLQISKQADNAEIASGDQVSFTIEVFNDGDSTATGVVVTDTLDSDLDWQTDTEGCEIANDVLTCDFGELEAQVGRSAHVFATSTPGWCGTISNMASVAASNDDPGSDDPTASASVTVACPDLEITKTAAEYSIVVGAQAIFTIAVTNHGDGAAHDVTISDTLPAGINWSTLNQSCVIASGVLTCDVGSLEPDGSFAVDVLGTPTLNTCGDIRNSATVTASNEPADAPLRNLSSTSIFVRCPGLTYSKVPDSSYVTAGDTIGFTIMMMGVGDEPAQDPVLDDPLPTDPGLVWTIDGGTNASDCAIEQGTLRCDFLDLARGDQVSVHISSPTTSESCGLIENTAYLDAANTASGSAGAAINVVCPDVAISKTAGATTVNAGDAISFTITVGNIGAGIARNVTVNDQLPAGITWSETSDDCAITGGTLSCTFGDLETQTSRSVQITGIAPARNCNAISNNATVSATNEASAVQGNNSASASIGVICPNVSITKQAEQGTISVGDTAQFNLTVTNSGAGTAYDVTVTDQLPAGISWYTTTSGCWVEDGVLHCQIGSLGPSATFNASVSGRTSLEDCGVISNTASVTASNESEAQQGNNSSQSHISANCADITFTKIADHDTVVSGDEIGFTLSIKNTGAGIARDMSLTDSLPVPLGLFWTIDGGANAENCSVVYGELQCFFGDLATDETATVHVTSPTNGLHCGTIDNTATFYGSNVVEGTASDDILVTCPNLIVSKTAVDDSVSAGDEVGFQMVVQNLGQGIARDVTLSDSLPDGIEWTVDSEDCSIEEGILSCEFGDLAPQATVTISVSGVTPNDNCAGLTNFVDVGAWNEPTDQTEDNHARADVTISCPDLKLTKVATHNTVTVGDQIEFTITVTNHGGGVARNVVMTDTLPAGITWSSDECRIENSQYRCEFDDDLAPGASESVTVRGTTDAADCGSISNTASVSSSTESSETLRDNQATATVTITCGTIEIVKTAEDGNGGEPPQQGACFELLRGETVFADGCTGADGKLTFAQLPVDTYLVRETSAPENYSVSPIWATIELEAGDTEQLLIMNELNTVDIPVFALQCLADPGPVDAAQIAAGAIPSGCVVVPGVDFGVTIDDSPSQPFTTGANGGFIITAKLFTTVVVSRSVDSVPGGFEPAAFNPALLTKTIDGVQPDQAGLVFVTVPAPTPTPTVTPSPTTVPEITPTPVTVHQLPSTGAGQGNLVSRAAWISIAMACLFFLFGAGVLRRRRT